MRKHCRHQAQWNLRHAQKEVVVTAQHDKPVFSPNRSLAIRLVLAAFVFCRSGGRWGTHVRHLGDPLSAMDF